ncbi:MAG: hypothetical protein CMM76_17510 [Rhodospirillaceae bacterium]|nr:hypothetical protein [Rhodospirillaceae bacterium]
MTDLRTTPPRTTTLPAQAGAVPPFAHVIGITSLAVGGFGIPAMLYISGEEQIEPASKWVLRAVAAATGVVAYPLAAHYLTRLRG